jgi:hypothetical protein
MRSFIVCVCLMFQAISTCAQLTEHFDYQSFKDAVTWRGTDSAWVVQSGRLQSNFHHADSSFYAATKVMLSGALKWQWWIWLNFNTSSLNYVDVYLMGDTANLLSSAVSGYFVRIGNTKDEVCLYRKDALAKTPVLLIDGRDGITDHSSSKLNIRVTRSDSGNWALWVDDSGTGSSWFEEGIAIDNMYKSASFTGLAVKQSTSSFFGKHYFDDFIVESTGYDTIVYHGKPGDVVIDEIMPAKYVELRNISDDTIQLNNWQLNNISLPSFKLLPDSMYLVAASPLDSDLLTLKNDNGVIINSVSYNIIDGRSLEMINVNWPCSSPDNWRSSVGSPGKYNSVDDSTYIPALPMVQNVTALDAHTVLVTFSGGMDSSSVTNKYNYNLLIGAISLSASSIAAAPPLYNNIYLHFDTSLRDDTVYELTLNNILDCAGRDIMTEVGFPLSLPVSPTKGDVVLNEVLYDPPVGIPEFVELYNNSKKTLRLSSLSFIRKRTDTPVHLPDILLYTGAYAAFTKDPSALCMQYHCTHPSDIYKLDLPALINGEGDIVLLGEDVLDSLHYSDKMQFVLADNTKGVSLERLSAGSNAWHSAASSVGYATPGYANSQQLPDENLPGELTLTPEIFTPDNDGKDDVLLIKYSVPAPGYIGNFIIFDPNGRQIKVLEQHFLLDTTGQITWDGREAKKTGIYILYGEIYNPTGAIKRWKLPVVLERR